MVIFAKIMMKKIAVIVAGGSGTRMGTNIPKQLLTINNKPILIYTVETFLATWDDIKIILVMPQSYLAEGTSLLAEYFPNHTIQCVAGGATRFESVKAGLSVIQEDAIIFVHDAVRCLVSSKLIQLGYETALLHGAAIPVISIKDSIRMIDGENSIVVNRDILRAVQTPQVFKSDILLPAFNQSYETSFTDEASVVEKMGHTVTLFSGEETNIKITVPADIEFATQVLLSR
jgi:2-C-methyl-D-erythritol 4-phosphate cytidylyltransferase